MSVRFHANRQDMIVTEDIASLSETKTTIKRKDLGRGYGRDRLDCFVNHTWGGGGGRRKS